MVLCSKTNPRTTDVTVAAKYSMCLRTCLKQRNQDMTFNEVILSQIALWSCKLPRCYIPSMDALMDPSDQALMEGLTALGPLLLGNRRLHEVSADEQHNKRHKSKGKNDSSSDGLQPEAVHAMLKLMGQLILSHERSTQLSQRQDCFVMFCQNRPEGIVPHLTCLAKTWREEWPKQQDNQRWLNLRTYLVQGVIKELLRRVQQLANSKAGDQLWEVATTKGTILPDGSWGYQKWSTETKQLIKAPKPPMTMQVMLRTLQTLEDLLDSNAHVIQFKSLRTDQPTIPWLLQLTHRETEVWDLLGELCHNSVWSLLGMSVKRHNQALSKQAMLLQKTLGKGEGKNKGQGKGTKTSQ